MIPRGWLRLVKEQQDFLVWYDYKRDCYVSNIAFVVAKEIGLPATDVAYWLAAWLLKKYPDFVEKVWVS